MRLLGIVIGLFVAVNVFTTVLVCFLIYCHPVRLVVRPEAPPLHDSASPVGSDRFDERSFERRFTSRGGWAVSERCQRPLSVLLLVYTTPAERRRRAVLRDTLLEDAAEQRFNWTAVFFTGRQPTPLLQSWVDLELATTGDLVELPFEDGYSWLSTKFVAAIRWAAEHCPRVEYVIKMDDDVLIDAFQLQKYLERMMPIYRRSLHCHVWKRMTVYRDPSVRFFESYEGFPGRAFYAYCSGRTVLMTYDVMRDLLRAASVIQPHTNDDAYVTGDLALVNNIGHVNIQERYQWDQKMTDECIFNGTCVFTHEYFPYGMTIGRRSQWGMVLWRQRLDQGETLDLSSRLQRVDYADAFNQTKAALLRVTMATTMATTRTTNTTS